ncbi:MAG: intracellular protease PfpI family [Ignavibacteria bacterium]|nr:MAG: intracellular protease PfpI family [Ignavibacteria bacterium]KAF0156413.1 MAG: intracellular protease PfpI family [Ignavibacteria bacterium]
MRIENLIHKKRSVLLFLPSQNFNEHEFLIISNSLEAAGYKIFIVSDSSFLCIGSNGLKIKNDVLLFNARESNFAGFIIIGGSGTRNYWSNSSLQNLAKKFASKNKPVGAICSAPIVLAKAGLLSENATCFPDDKKALEREGVEFKNMPVVKINKIVTGQDPASSTEFINTFLFELSKL